MKDPNIARAVLYVGGTFNRSRMSALYRTAAVAHCTMLYVEMPEDPSATPDHSQPNNLNDRPS